MSRLIAFGSSIIMGASAFPGILAQRLNRNYVSRVKPTNSNHKISRMILSQEYESNDIVLVDWTTTIRNEFRTEQGWMGTSMATYKAGCGFEEHWYLGPGKWEYTGVYSSLKEILVAQIFLQKHRIPYVFTFDYNDIIDSTLLKQPDEYIGMLTTLIDWNYIALFDGHGFLNWCKQNNLEFNGSHPTQTSHKLAADYLLDNFDLFSTCYTSTS